MKQKNSKFALAGALALTSIAFVACDSGSDPKPEPTPAPIVAAKANSVTITVTDAATGAVLAVPVKLALGGALGGKVTDASNVAISSLSITSGVAAVYTADAGTLEITATAAGYMAGGTAVTVSGGAVVANIALVSASAPPATVKVTTGNAQVAGGVVAQEVKLTAVAQDTTGENAGAPAVELTIPATTSLKTSTGVALEGPVSLTVASFDLEDAAAQAAVPGGFEVKNAAGVVQPVNIAAVASIEIKDAAGNVATTFDKPLKLRLDLPVSALNPSTGLPYTEGQTVDVLSFSLSKGAWVTEGSSLLKEDSNGVYAELSITHLSAWAVGDVQDNGCTSPLVLTFPRLTDLNLDLAIQGAGYGKFLNSAGNNRLEVKGVPTAQSLDFSVSFNGTSIAKFEGRQFTCGETVNIADTLAVVFAKHSFNVTTVCNDSSGTASPSTGLAVTLLQAGKFKASAVTGTNGVADVDGLVSGGTYNYVLDFATGKTPLTGTVTGNNGTTNLQIPVTCPVTTGASGS